MNDDGIRPSHTEKHDECNLWRLGQLNRELDVPGTALHDNKPMPEPQRLDLPLLPTGQGERFYLERFMRAFGEDQNGTALIDLPSAHRLSVSRLLFTDHKSGRLKIAKQGRAPYVPYIAETIKRPDEIRLRAGDYGDRALYFLSRYWIGNELTGVLAIFAERGTVWEGWTGYQMPLKSAAQAAYFESKRAGGVVFRRPET